MTRLATAGTTLLAALTLSALAPAADSDLSFKRRNTEEKHFAAQVGEAVVKAAHGTARKVPLSKYDYALPKVNRTDLVWQMEYRGAISDKRYIADIVVKIDSTNKDAWEVLNIDYVDT